MKVLACNGSYRTNGNTRRVLGLIEDQMRREADRMGEGLDFEVVDLGYLNLQMCRGCRICFDRGEEHCPLKDDLLPLKAKMKEADGILAATPVYVNDVSGITKNWIDRLAHVCHRPEFAGKCAYLVATVGAGPASHALTTLNMALRSWGFYMVGQAGFKTGALMKGSEIQAHYQKQAGKVAGKLLHAIRGRKFTRPSFLSLMTFRIQQRFWQQAGGESVDYRYWKNLGWVEPERTFYISHHANRAKVTMARLAGAAIAPFVS